MTGNKPKTAGRHHKPLSLYPMTPEDALRRALSTPPPVTRASHYRETATITKTGPGGTMYQNGGWRGKLSDGSPVAVLLTAKVQVRSGKIPTLKVGQVVNVSRHPNDPERCSVAPSDVQFVSPSKAKRSV